ncbi:MAG: DUF1194 domain-containing protein [Pseudomonadota bacterium]
MRLLTAFILLVCGVASVVQANCRQALALALDVSGSVDAREYRLQIGGIASALAEPEVRDKLLAMPSAPVRLMIFEWSGPADQRVLLPWTAIDGAATLERVIETLARVERLEATPGTALGTAMRQGAFYLDQQRDCWKRTLDISGDGKSNLGPRPAQVKPQLERQGIVINALVIGVDDPNIGDVRQADIGELSSYFNAHVILGPDAFVIAALGYADYARAMKLKLLRELEGLVFSRLE